MKLNLGAGRTHLDGYEDWDLVQGRQAYPLALPDGSVEAIYASHLLEHFSHRQTLDVLREWFRVLKPGGELKVAVPDFESIARRFLAGEQGPWEAYTMGSHVDANDRHLAVFNRQKLAEALAAAGFEDVRPWTAEIPDCASLPISLNLAGTKPNPRSAENPPQELVAPSAPGMPIARKVTAPLAKTVAVWSVPRLGFMDTFKSIYSTLPAFGIPMSMGQGVFWGQALEAAMENAIKLHGAEWFLSLDYDSVFTAQDLSDLFRIVNAYPGEIDVLAPFQWCRTRNSPLFSPLPGPDGKLPPVTNLELLATDHFPCDTVHFGLTLIRAEAVKRMPHPWFCPQPAPDGTWGEGKVDDDIYFWRKMRQHGARIFMAPRVVIGHAELDLRWPGHNLQLLHQQMNEYNAGGKPPGVFGTDPASPSATKDTAV